MKYFKKFIKLFKYATLGLLGYLVVVLMISFITVNKQKSKFENKNIVVYVLSNGVHTDIVVPIKNEYKDWSSQIPFTDTLSKDVNMNFVAFGWGDKGFYLDTPTWADLKTSTALKAISGFNSTAMHVTFYKKLLENENCIKFYIEPKNYLKLVNYIENSFKLKNGVFSKIETDTVYGRNDVFYDANGSYSMFYTCNTWSNQALKSANQKAALWTIFDFGIFNHYK